MQRPEPQGACEAQEPLGLWEAVAVEAGGACMHACSAATAQRRLAALAAPLRSEEHALHVSPPSACLHRGDNIGPRCYNVGRTLHAGV